MDYSLYVYCANLCSANMQRVEFVPEQRHMCGRSCQQHVNMQLHRTIRRRHLRPTWYVCVIHAIVSGFHGRTQDAKIETVLFSAPMCSYLDACKNNGTCVDYPPEHNRTTCDCTTQWRGDTCEERSEQMTKIIYNFHENYYEF